MQKIVFLDIDGPIIPTPMYFIDGMCSFDRSVVSTIAIGWLRRLVKISNAKIVCNSAHNYMETDHRDPIKPSRNLMQDLNKHGLPEDFFHDDWRTEFPNPQGMKFSSSDKNRRMLAIENWIAKNGDVDWIGFDDELYTDNPRLIHIDFDYGIDYKAFQKACDFWNLDSNTIIL